jgi:hypothetical protein
VVWLLKAKCGLRLQSVASGPHLRALCRLQELIGRIQGAFVAVPTFDDVSEHCTRTWDATLHIFGKKDGEDTC